MASGGVSREVGRDLKLPEASAHQALKTMVNHSLVTALIAGLGTILAGRITAQTFTVLHTFTSASGPNVTNSDGANPSAGLILSGNTLYGTAVYGGRSGWGTVFAVQTNGTSFTATYHFTGGSDGANPYAELILSGNILYGTARKGGSWDAGTVFAVHMDGTGFTVLNSFTATDPGGKNSDGANPHAELILSGNTLYGTAEYGGSSGKGTVFAINTDGSGFTNLHNFAAGAYNSFSLYTNSEGANPSAGLVLSSNTLYGTASHGGISGKGTVFAINADGTGFTNLHSFTATPPYPQPQTNSDGANPTAGLVLSSATLYGTTAYGGTSGNGTVFSLLLASVSVTAPRLTIMPSESSAILTWPANPGGFVLQSAPSITGTFTNLPGATSPYTNPINGAQQFFRLISN